MQRHAFLAPNNLCGRYDALKAVPAGLTYYRFHCGEPVVVKADGVWIEGRAALTGGNLRPIDRSGAPQGARRFCFGHRI